MYDIPSSSILFLYKNINNFNSVHNPNFIKSLDCLNYIFKSGTITLHVGICIKYSWGNIVQKPNIVEVGRTRKI